MMLLAGLLASSILSTLVLAQTAAGRHSAETTSATAAVPLTSAAWHARHDTFYRRNWGIEVIGVRSVSTGELIQFSYRVLDPKKAAPLNEKKETPYLIDNSTGAKLEVPQMEKIGMLRQTAAPETGRVYWMLFANAGRALKPGASVSVVIGRFRADGLTVESAATPVVASLKK